MLDRDSSNIPLEITFLDKISPIIILYFDSMPFLLGQIQTAKSKSNTQKYMLLDVNTYKIDLKNMNK